MSSAPATSEAVEAVVVGRQDLGEADRIVRLLTADHGRVDVIARGARASRKRFGGALDPGTRLSVSWRRGRGELPLLTDAAVLASPRRAREDYGRLVLLGYGCDLLAVLSEHGLAGAKGFGLLGAWLARLEEGDVPTEAARIALEAKALTFAGLAPRTVSCVACGDALDDPAVFDVDGGGGMHARCGTGRPVAAAALAHVEALRRRPLAEAEGTVDTEVRWLLADFVEHHTRRPLRARALLGSEVA